MRSKDALKWTYQGGASAITQAQLGDPTSGTVYALCLYHGSTLRSAIRLSDPSKWSAIGTTGYKYKDSTASAGGITAVTLKGGAAGKTKLVFTGKGDNLPDLLPMAVPPSITVVARNSSTDTCFSAIYSSRDDEHGESAQGALIERPLNEATASTMSRRRTDRRAALRPPVRVRRADLPRQCGR